MKENNNDSFYRENKEIIDEFVSEAYELLDDAEKSLNDLTENSENYENAVDTIFRLFHSLKGSASFLNFSNVKEVTHVAENLLDKFKKKEISPGKKEIDVIYETFTVLEKLINSISKTGTDNNLIKESNLIKEKIQLIINKNNNKLEDNDFNKYFDQSFNLLLKIKKILKILSDSDFDRKSVFDILSNTYTLRMSLKILGYTELWKLTSEITNLLNSILSEDVVFNNEINSVLGEMYEIIRKGLRSVLDNPDKDPDIKNKNEIINKLKTLLGEDIKPIRPIGEILVEMGVVDNQTIEEALRLQKTEEKSDIFSTFDTKKRDIRVDADKFDKIFTMVEEITSIAGMMSNFSPDAKDFDIERYYETLYKFNNLISDFQRLSMSIRMLPLESLFNKMKRLVNQLSKKLGKSVELQIQGSITTTVDKDILDEITYPLVHIIRNAVDHGIEDVETRKQLDKKPTGLIELKAENKGNEIWVSVSDDGKGLDKEKIHQKAYEKGLVSESINDISDSRLWNLIFESGFSTNEDVSEVSGRGVGMSVVRENLKKIRGKISIKTKKGTGTKIILKIPIRIMEVMTLMIKGIRYSIPTLHVVEVLSIEKEDIVKLENNKLMLKLRDETLPLLILNHITNNIAELSKNDNINIDDLFSEKGTVVVIKKDKQKLCLLVDYVENIQQAVIKNPPKYAENIKSILGFSILGNGHITLILDINIIIENYFDD